jgi:hypothetical protein
MSEDIPEEPPITLELTEAELKEREKAHKARDNEEVKYIANAADRLSTAAFAVGIFGPASAIMINPIAFDSQRFVLLGIATMIWLMVGSLLHTWGRRTLMKGWKL